MLFGNPSISFVIDVAKLRNSCNLAFSFSILDFNDQQTFNADSVIPYSPPYAFIIPYFVFIIYNCNFKILGFFDAIFFSDTSFIMTPYPCLPFDFKGYFKAIKKPFLFGRFFFVELLTTRFSSPALLMVFSLHQSALARRQFALVTFEFCQLHFRLLFLLILPCFVALSMQDSLYQTSPKYNRLIRRMLDSI